MAKFYPPIPNNDYKGEVEIFELFKNYVNDPDNDTSSWHIFHSLNLSSTAHIINREGEIDFYILIPGYGTVILEIKGSYSIKFENNQWIFGQEVKKQSPFEQAKNNMYSLQNYIRQKFPEYKNMFFCYGVIFPYVQWPYSDTIQYNEWQLIDTTKLKQRNIGKLIKELISKEIEIFKNKNKKIKYLNSNEASKIVRSLIPSASSRTDKSIITDKINDITLRNLKKFDNLFEDNPRVVVNGAAGTGKTMAAINLAQQFSLNFLFTCYNSLLSEFLDTQFPQNKNVICTHIHKYIVGIINKYDHLKKIPKSRYEWDELAYQAGELFESNDLEKFDYLIIDEAQDVLSDSLLLFFDIILKNGLDKGKWAIFGDFDYQDIFIKANTLDEYNPVKLRLSDNLRNPESIGYSVEQVLEYKHKIIYNEYLNPIKDISIDYIIYKNFDDFCKKLDALLNELSNDQELKHSVILQQTPMNSILPKFLDFNLNKFKLHEINSVKSLDQIGYTSVGKFKGLEKEIVILTDIEKFDNYGKKLTYIGLSRATQKAYLFLSEENKQKL